MSVLKLQAVFPTEWDDSGELVRSRISDIQQAIEARFPELLRQHSISARVVWMERGVSVPGVGVTIQLSALSPESLRRWNRETEAVCTLFDELTAERRGPISIDRRWAAALCLREAQKSATTPFVLSVSDIPIPSLINATETFFRNWERVYVVEMGTARRDERLVFMVTADGRLLARRPEHAYDYGSNGISLLANETRLDLQHAALSRAHGLFRSRADFPDGATFVRELRRSVSWRGASE